MSTSFSEMQDWLRGKQLFVVTNRGPLTHALTPEGEVSSSRSAGGVVSAVAALSRFVPFTWVAGAVTDADRLVASRSAEQEVQLFADGAPTLIQMVSTPKRAFQKFYDVFSVGFLWFTHHYLWDLSRQPDATRALHTAWDKGYRPVNEAFSDTVSEVAKRLGGLPVVLLHDYHLCLVAGLLRPRLPDAVISHFMHIPWPGPRYWCLMPRTFRESILKSLSACDVVGFQTEQDVHNFLHTCKLTLDDVVVDYHRGILSTPERDVLVRAYPISVDVQQLQELANTPEVRTYEKEMAASPGVKTIVRVDRLDPSKNVVRGFKAFERLLQEHPELLGKVRLLALLVPSREGVSTYRRYQRQTFRIVEKVNNKYGTGNWQPITVFSENNYDRAIALFRSYDVLLVNPVMDGMNLVAKEGPAVNTRNGVVVLSETAGAFSDLAGGVIATSAIDIEDLMHALYSALTMPEEERARRAEHLLGIVSEHDLQHWLLQQLEDLRALSESSAMLTQTTA